MKMTKLLQVQNLKTYFGTPDNAFKAVDDISFDIEAGETFCLVGESGSGKSITSLSAIQLVPKPAGFHPQGGKILFNYRHNGTEKVINLLELSEASKRQVRGAKIAMIFQEPMTSLNPVLSIGYQICEPLKRHMKLSHSQANAKALELLKQVQIPSPEQRLKEYPHQLSGGMRQRVMIAMALSCEPDLLIADEPTTALDVTVQAEILRLMKDLQKRKGTAILFITHDFGVVNQVADHVAVMKLGKIVENGTKEQILRNPQHAYTKELIASLPSNLDKPSYKNEEQVSQDEMKNEKPLINIKDYKVYFPIKEGFFKKTVGHVKAVDNVSLSIPKGQILALVGESGSGKTTLGKSLLQLIPSTSGEVWFENEDITKLSHGQMRKHRHDLQIIFQDPFSSLNPRMMIGDAIMEGMIAQGIGKSYQDRLEGVKEALRLAQMDENVIRRYPHEFSGGQRQRIGIARCLAVKPKFIVCDEITSALDVSVQASILKLLLKLRDQLGLTLLFITHNMEVVEYLADEVAVMYKGKIVEKGPTEQVCKTPSDPYTQKLLAAVPRMNGTLDA